MKSSKVYYSANLDEIEYEIPPNGYFVIKLSSGNAHKWHKLIQNCITAFNSEVDWDEMWNLEQALTRFQQGHIMFVYVKVSNKAFTCIGEPIGYVWFNKDYLYNMFMLSKRKTGHTIKFVRSACHDLELGITNIHLHCDDWNIKAQKMFEKAGFKKVGS